MTYAFLYWFLVLLVLLYGGYSNRTNFAVWVPGGILELLLFIIIGLRLFGAPLHG